MWQGVRIINWPDTDEDTRTYLPNRKLVLHVAGNTPEDVLRMLTCESELDGEPDPTLERIGAELLAEMEALTYPFYRRYPIMALGEPAFLTYTITSVA